MNRIFRKVNRFTRLWGLDFSKFTTAAKDLPYYLRCLRVYRSQPGAGPARFKFGRLSPCFGDRFTKSGVARGQYFHQDLLVARRVFLNQPVRHVDIGSRIDGFVAHLASFRQVEVLDIRELEALIPNVSYTQCDIMGALPPSLSNYCDSISCLHALEHFGLGRYGDPVRYDGYEVGFRNIHKILQPGGKFYFSVPIGPQRVEFNAHRVFALDFLVPWVESLYRIDRFSYVDDRGDLHEDAPLPAAARKDNYGCNYGCGIFELAKLS